jgi:hypothetical protein
LGLGAKPGSKNAVSNKLLMIRLACSYSVAMSQQASAARRIARAMVGIRDIPIDLGLAHSPCLFEGTMAAPETTMPIFLTISNSQIFLSCRKTSSPSATGTLMQIKR